MATNLLISIYKKHRKSLFYAFFLVWMFCVFWGSAFANGTSPDPVVWAELTQDVVEVLNGIITGASAILAMVTAFITIFLYPGWVNGTLFGLQDYLKIMWVLVSNVVYFIFAFVLIAIAFMNIIGKGEGTWELKQAMPKFIIWVLIVPFSWFFVQFVLSISAVLTIGILTLPYDSFQNETLLQEAISDSEIWTQEICKDIIITLTGEQPAWSTSFSGPNGESLGENLYCADGGTVTVEQIFTGEGGWAGLNDSVFGVISVYTYGILKVQDFDTTSWIDLQTIKTIADLIFKIFFDILFILVYMLLMVALFLALFVRWIRLWIYMMLSPAFGLLYFFGKSGDGFGKSGEKFNIKEFIALALVPVYVSAALSFGLVFILVASKGIQEQAMEWETDTLSVWGFSLEIVWAHGSGETEASPIAKLIIEIFGVAILWIAVMAALWASKTTESIVQPIAKFGEDVGALAAKAPTYAPIIPTGRWPDGRQQTMGIAGLAKLWSWIRSGVEDRATRRWSSFAQELIWGGADIAELSSSLNSLNNTIRSSSGAGDSEAAVARQFRDALRSVEPARLRTSREFRDTLSTLLSRYNIEGINVNSDNGMAQAVDAIMARMHAEWGTSWNTDFFWLNDSIQNTWDITTWTDLEARLAGWRDNTAPPRDNETPGEWNTFVFNATNHISGTNVTDGWVTDMTTAIRWTGRSNMTEAEVGTEVRRMLSSAEAWVNRDDAIARVLTALWDFVQESE